MFLLWCKMPPQIKMEMVQAGSGNTPKSYTLNMHNDFVPMCIFSESNQGWEPDIFKFVLDVSVYLSISICTNFPVDNVVNANYCEYF